MQLKSWKFRSLNRGYILKWFFIHPCLSLIPFDIIAIPSLSALSLIQILLISILVLNSSEEILATNGAARTTEDMLTTATDTLFRHLMIRACMLQHMEPIPCTAAISNKWTDRVYAISRHSKRVKLQCDLPQARNWASSSSSSFGKIITTPESAILCKNSLGAVEESLLIFPSPG